MACEIFVPYHPQAKTLTVVEQANGIIAEFQQQGFVLTLRQLFYQFVARDQSRTRSRTTSGSATSSPTPATGA